jgi:hypothetical protein
LGTSLMSFPLLLPPLAPLPEPLPAESLVELLKHSLCVGEDRCVVLTLSAHAIRLRLLRREAETALRI